MMQQNNGLDKNQLIGFVVFTLFLLGVMLYFQNQQIEQEQQQVATEQKVGATNNIVKATNLPVKANEIQKVSLKNDKISVEFSGLGGQISSLLMNNYKAYNKKTNQNDLPLYLIERNNSSYGFKFKDKSGKEINTKDLVFTPQSNGNTVTMTSALNGGAIVQFIYTLKDYQVDFQVATKGLSSIVSGDKASFVWNYTPKEQEKGRAQEQQHTEFFYAFNNYKSTDYDARTSMDETKEVLNWLAVKQQFFTPIIEAKNGFKNSIGHQDMIEEGEYLKKFDFNGELEITGGEFNQSFSWYFLPLDLKLLKTFDKNFDEIIPLGWSFIGTMNRWIFIPMYNMISSWGIAAGWVIFLMTILVKVVLSPIMYKQHKLSAMMKVIRPEIEEVNAKLKDADPMKKQQAVMEVYRKAGVNQLAGCLPALLQIPIFYALFRFFPNMLDLRGKGFWFATDLTAYDDLIKLPFHIPFLGEHISIFALACTAVLLIYTVMTAGNMQQPTQEGMPNMKPLMYIFPVMFLFFLNSAASGLSWYYFVSNGINIIIILVIKYWILDEKTIHAQIQANKAKPKKEGKFQKRMREMMEKAQEQQRLQEQQRAKRK
ncbi:membrane protein insertase YidC [Riemerella anatipestifer]|uniref:Membrane protein insertase YidC n=1 Tax=Riemerella anatipestifer TaxID=34085 RepID=A0AAP6HIB8_RIEAN|nr:membrane protein insertase YidC [Riemerella anatipestifer]MBT0550135.1 membrane protein insertase YidC [Riemerella anatipestifer]MBT0556720.1 membrane protein insertase YidC [Riemerella anatipestifer]MBT0560897.1 membrane protein insertase YidC [Riemerella anatipestifer]MCD5968709.1 membrane protein insertase YidC [Riemerella anatipestifer]MCU7541210.1 membrane protein insertase YidC [Riemerella anatipestifer]